MNNVAPDDRRRRIIEAGYRIIGQRGLAETSVKEVAKEAGVAPALVHYYFESKEHLLLEVAAEVGRQYCRTMVQNFETLGNTPLDQGLAQALAHRTTRIRERLWYTILYDLYAASLHKPALANQVREVLHDSKRDMQSVVKLIGQHLQVQVPGSEEAVASVILAAMDGLAIQYLLDPDFDLDQAMKALGAMIGGMIRR